MGLRMRVHDREHIGAALRRPSDTGPDAGCGTGARAARGFLLIHGFTDSPYVLRDLAERLRALDRCAAIRTGSCSGSIGALAMTCSGSTAVSQGRSVSPFHCECFAF